MVDEAFLSRSYDLYGRIEEQLNEALEGSLAPRGPGMLYDLVSEISLPAGAMVLDVGCGEGRHAIELAKRFGVSVCGVDPVQRHIEIADQELASQAGAVAGLGDLVRFEPGTAERIPVRDAVADLVWCRDVLVHLDDLGAAYAEFRRVLKPGGRILVYQMFATDRLEPREAAWLLPTMGCVTGNMRPEHTEAAIRAAGLHVDRCIVLGTEWGEYGQEHSGKGGRKLLHAARLLRDPDRYVAAFGRTAYEIMLGDCLWHVYRMIGKLSSQVWVLSRC
jgi:SAM-dependent methyltransferase